MNNDNQEILLKLINGYYFLSNEYHQLIFEECEIVQLGKQQHLIETGQREDSEYFLIDGIIHRYTLVEKGEFITTGFYVGPAVITPNFARTLDGKSIFSLQVLVDSTVIIIPAKKLDAMRNSEKEIRKWGQRVVEQELKKNFTHETRFRSNSAKERLIHLRKEYPNIENLVPHTCIASYIGVTPVSLSRLRKELIH